MLDKINEALTKINGEIMPKVLHLTGILIVLALVLKRVISMFS